MTAKNAGTPMKLVIETMMNKVTPDSTAPFGSRVLPEYERTSIVSYSNGGGWSNRHEWIKDQKTKRNFLGFDERGRSKIDLGRSYGIHSYQLVSLED